MEDRGNLGAGEQRASTTPSGQPQSCTAEEETDAGNRPAGAGALPGDVIGSLSSVCAVGAGCLSCVSSGRWLGSGLVGRMGVGEVVGRRCRAFVALLTVLGLAMVSGFGWGSVYAPFNATTGNEASSFTAAAYFYEGAASAWGVNTNGRLGDGTTTSRSSPVPVGADVTWVNVANGELHSCGTRSDHTLWCWGSNGNGRLGDGTTTQRLIPTQVAGSTWGKVAAGETHTCATRTDGTLWCWGFNNDGQLGDGTTTARVLPGQVPGTTWRSVAAGSANTCATRTDDSLWCWGINGNGQLGDGTTTRSLVPKQVPGTWAALAVGDLYTCAIATDSSIWCWGKNTNGQLGDGTLTQRLVPTALLSGGTDWVTVSAGTLHTCATRVDNTLYCWGENTDGRVGDGTITDRLSLVQIPGTTWRRVTAALSHTCAIRTDRTVWCWGDNANGRLGDGTTTGRVVPTQVPSLSAAVLWVGARASHSIVAAVA